MLKPQLIRLLLHATGYLLLGVACSSVIAWTGLVLRGDTRAVLGGMLSVQAPGLEWYRSTSDEQEWLRSETRSVFALSAIRRTPLFSGADTSAWKRRNLPGWVRVREEQARPEQYMTDFAVGWPARMWSANLMEPAPGRWRVGGGVEVAGLNVGHRTAGPSRLALPLTPVWSGVAINSPLCALLIAAVVRMMRWGRRFVRTHRDRCMDCGYGIRGLTRCPECGKDVESHDRYGSAEKVSRRSV